MIDIFCKSIESIKERYSNIEDPLLCAIIELYEALHDEMGGHAERTRDYAVLLSKELKMNSSFINDIQKASLLHDIGKIGIKSSILLKRGKLTKAEFEEIKMHTIIGSEIIRRITLKNNKIDSYLAMAIDVSLYHHEKYDGSGYPYGLSEKQIPAAAKIVAVADAYDAITSNRIYKKALDHEEAVRRIQLDCGKHFDPYIIMAFTRIQDKFKALNNQLIKR